MSFPRNRVLPWIWVAYLYSMAWKKGINPGIECKVCGAMMKGNLGFPKHLSIRHSLSTRQYYDLHLKRDGEGQCLSCKSETGFKGLTHGYREFCSHACSASSDIVKERRRSTTLMRFGTGNAFSSPDVRARIKDRMFERFGVDHPMRSQAIVSKMRETNLERYGNEWQIASGSTREKSAATNLERHGSENPFASPLVREKIRETNLERFGTEYPLQAEVNKAKSKETMESRHGAPFPAQVPSIRKKQARAAKFTVPIEVNGATLDCQGTYEQRFVREYLDSFGFSGIDISQDVSVPYVDHRGKSRRYIPDFVHVPSGTLIEVKSTWTLDRNGSDDDEWEIVLAKTRGAESAGYKLLFVMMNRTGISWVARSSEELIEMARKA